MPLVILGLIVVLGGALLIYYQLGPKVTKRLNSGPNFFSSLFGGQEGNPGGFQNAEDDANAPDAGAGQTGAEKGLEDDGKVLFIFGDGEREERSFGEDGGSPSGGDDRHDENA